MQLSAETMANNTEVEKAIERRGASITEFRKALDGRMILPGDAEYDQARMVFYGGFDCHPALIARVANAGDVARVISLARETGLELAVRSGGHSTVGHSVSEGGIVLDVRGMRALDIDPQNRSAWVETGLTTGEFTAAADAFDLATGFGDTGSVGIGGITLGGGIGYLVRKHGLTIDSLLAADIVTADGQLLHVNAENHPDLFWAIRGGGGNFGVATSLQLRLHLLGEIVGGMLVLPATCEVLSGFIAAAEAAPDELSTILNIMPAPPMPFLPQDHHGKIVALASLVYAGGVEDGMQAVAPFRGLAQPLADMVQPMRYKEIFTPEEGDYHPTMVAHTMFMEKVNHKTAETILQFLQSSTSSMRVLQLRVLGGAMARVPTDATAFAHRQSRIMANLASFYEGAEDKAKQQAWVEDFATALQQDDEGAYVNFMGVEGEGRVRAAYPGETWERLRTIKARYDPTNLFRLNQNIPPRLKKKTA